MKKIFLITVLLCLPLAAQTYYLKIWVNGALTAIPVSEIRKITFDSVLGASEHEKKEAVISAFELFQNYPNPFNPSTQIEYQIPTAGNVVVQIYKITGELMTTLLSSEQSAGRHTITWNGKDASEQPAASGIYIYRVVFGSSLISKKMILLK